MITLDIVRFCAIECELQCSGERSVFHMVLAWDYAISVNSELPGVDDVLKLGALVEPEKNEQGFREVAVWVGSDIKGDWRLVPRQIELLVQASERLVPEAWFREYEEIHPFVDGNGRTGVLLYNWLRGTLDRPEWAPNYWNDPRRKKNEGAP